MSTGAAGFSSATKPRVIVVAASLVAGAVPAWISLRYTRDINPPTLIYGAVLGLTGVLWVMRSAGAQFVARSMWWLTFGFASLFVLSMPDGHRFSYHLLAMVIATAVALLASGWIDPWRTGVQLFAPGRRSVSLLSMIAGLIDTAEVSRARRARVAARRARGAPVRWDSARARAVSRLRNRAGCAAVRRDHLALMAARVLIVSMTIVSIVIVIC